MDELWITVTNRNGEEECIPAENLEAWKKKQENPEILEEPNEVIETLLQSIYEEAEQE